MTGQQHRTTSESAPEPADEHHCSDSHAAPRAGRPAALVRLGITSPALLAPMSGITDWPFRQLAHQAGAGLVITEMIASRQLAADHHEARRKLKNETVRPFVVQLAGREARWLALGARIAADMGADMIDINMGCPAKQVTKGAAGAALMRDPALALSLIEATIKAVQIPVTLKMRLGWDHTSMNAPEIARQAEQAGIAMITIHGRTRNQFYNGSADWQAVRRVREQINIPLVINGDITSTATARRAMQLGGADAVMIGRGAQGCPWLPGHIGHELRTGQALPSPTVGQQRDIALTHYEALLGHYGTQTGRRAARKHLGWYIDHALAGLPVTGPDSVSDNQQAQDQARHWRRVLCGDHAPKQVMRAIHQFYEQLLNRNLPQLTI